MLESLTVEMSRDDPKLQDYIYFEKYLLSQPKWLANYRKGLRSYEIGDVKDAYISEDLLDDENMEEVINLGQDLESSFMDRSDDEDIGDHLSVLQGSVKSGIPGESVSGEIRSVPAIYHTYSCKNGRRYGLIRVHPKVIEELSSVNNLLD